MFATMGSVIADPNPDPAKLMQWQLSVQIPMTLIQYAVMAFVGVRFGRAAATSVARRELSVAEAWTVTSDRFCALFGSFLLLWILFGLVYAVIASVTYGPIFTPLFQEIWASYSNPSPERAEELMRQIYAPSNLAIIGVGYALGILDAFGYALMALGVNARAAQAALEDGKVTSGA